MADGITIDTKQVDALNRRMAQFMRRGSDLRKPLREVGMYYARRIDRRFKGRGPNNLGERWADLSPSTKKKTGRSIPGLWNPDIMFSADKNSVRIYPTKVSKKRGRDFIKFHHPPEMTGHASKGIMPNRAFMFVGDDDPDKVIDFFQRHEDRELGRLARRM